MEQVKQELQLASAQELINKMNEKVSPYDLIYRPRDEGERARDSS